MFPSPLISDTFWLMSFPSFFSSRISSVALFRLALSSSTFCNVRRYSLSFCRRPSSHESFSESLRFFRSFLMRSGFSRIILISSIVIFIAGDYKKVSELGSAEILLASLRSIRLTENRHPPKDPTLLSVCCFNSCASQKWHCMRFQQSLKAILPRYHLMGLLVILIDRPGQ